MKTPTFPPLMVLALAALALAMPNRALGTFVVFSAGGDSTAASIQPTVDVFRSGLGTPNNGNTAGPLATGRREINWDGGGTATTTLSGTPFSGFQDTRGALFSTPGTGFVQATPSGLGATLSNPTYAATFGATFSPLRLFTPIGSNITDVSFYVPGSSGALPATVGGFGAIFSDVDLANTTRIDFFDINNVLLFGQAVAPATVSSGGLSFLGAIAGSGEQIFRVRITTGNAALGPNDGPGVDVVVMDDFLFREPQAAGAVPDAGSAFALLAGTLTAIAASRRTFRRLA